MKNIKIIEKLTISLIIILFAFSINSCSNKDSNESKKENVYNRIIKTGKIKAGYLVYPPALMKDTKTGKFSGIFYEVLEQAAKNLNLSIEWTEEVGWGSQIEGLETNRYDIIGSPVWANPNRGKLTSLSIPVYYSGIGIYVRKDDNRFSSDLNLINTDKVSICTIDGETADLIARTQFPNANRVSLPQLSDISQMFLNVASKKADICFAEPYYAFKYLESNPNSIENIVSEKPLRVLGNCYMFKKDEFQLKHMLDVAIEDLINSGFVDQVIDKYEPYPNTFYRVALPYRLKK